MLHTRLDTQKTTGIAWGSRACTLTQFRSAFHVRFDKLKTTPHDAPHSWGGSDMCNMYPIRSWGLFCAYTFRCLVWLPRLGGNSVACETTRYLAQRSLGYGFPLTLRRLLRRVRRRRDLEHFHFLRCTFCRSKWQLLHEQMEHGFGSVLFGKWQRLSTDRMSIMAGFELFLNYNTQWRRNAMHNRT